MPVFGAGNGGANTALRGVGHPSPQVRRACKITHPTLVRNHIKNLEDRFVGRFSVWPGNQGQENFQAKKVHLVQIIQLA